MLWIWLTVIIVACLLEWATQVQLISIWAALGGVVALILELAGVGREIQIIVFFAVTIAAILLTRPIAKKMTGFAKTPTNADMNVGKQGFVTKIVDEEQGIMRVKVDNSDWSAVTEDKMALPVGTEISVKEIQGVKLIVQPFKDVVQV